MAVSINEFKLPMAPMAARDFVQRATDSLGIFIDLDRICELLAVLTLSSNDLAREVNEIAGQSVSLGDKSTIIQALLDHGANMSDFQTNWRKPDMLYLNADAKSNLERDENLDKAGRDILRIYQTFTTNNYNLSILRSLTDYPRSKILSFDGHRMLKVNPEWRLLNTSRIGSASPNIQGLSRDLGDIFTYPAGYVLVRADSKQIEPRINFSHFIRDDLIVKMISYYDDAYFGLLHYCTASEADLRAFRENFDTAFKQIEITDEIVNKRQTIKTLTNAGSYGSSNLQRVDHTLASAFDKRVKHHPARIEMERKVAEAVDRGVTTFYGAFGTPVTPAAKESYTPGSPGYRNHMIRCGINNPIQVTASELMICGMDVARQLLEEASDSYLIYYKHDECCFLVSVKDAEKGFVEKFGEVTAYNVSGWIPIGSDLLIGKKDPVFESYL